MDKFRLNWNGFDENIREYFKKLRCEQRLFDVTLVTEDGQQLQAHKIILSAGSNFFNDIFMSSNHSNMNMLVYLKGITSGKLEPVIDFIYNGEVFIIQEQIELFIETGKELQVKGLEGDLTGVDSNSFKTVINSAKNEHEYYDYENEKVLTGSSDENEVTVAKMDKSNLQLKTNDEFCLKINQIIEKNKTVWTCKICGKTARFLSEISRHAGVHIEGMPHACHICSKTFQNKECLRKHISRTHTDLFSCDSCGKSGMSKMAYRNHKNGMHNY